VFTLIEHGDLFSPQPIGAGSLLLANGRIERVVRRDVNDGREFSASDLEQLGFAVDVIDASGCYVIPGLIDPHAHLIGAGGEQGPGSRMPEMTWRDIVASGITTIVGCLGTDCVARSMRDLLGKARELEANGLTTFLYTGGFPVPPATITGSVTDDIVLIDKIIGVGEVAIADERSSQPSVDELARTVSSAHIGGMIAGKAGVTHVHVGPSSRRLSILHELLDRHDIRPRDVYPTHVTRTSGLLDEAIALARRGCFVDTDAVEDETAQWIARYIERGGRLDRFTVSSDAHTPGGTPEKLFRTLVSLVMDLHLPLEAVLPFFTSNTAAVLGVSAAKGELKAGADADVVVMRRDTMEIVDVISRGQRLYAARSTELAAEQIS
jgi:beta-aspartyl-dipeptidase (metallo-type)